MMREINRNDPELRQGEKEMKRIKMPQQGIREKLNTTLLDTKKIVEFGVVEELAKRIVSYAEKHKMTISNIRESVEKVEIYMEDNAVLQDDRDPDDLNPRGNVMNMAAVNEKWKTKVRKVSAETGYDFDFLWRIWTEILEEEDVRGKTEEEKWDYFRGVSIEHDW